MEHHDLDVWPVPKDKKPRFINEPWLIDDTILSVNPECPKEKLKEPEGEKDNIRFYVPLDINRKAILRRLRWIINKYGEATEDNEIVFSLDVDVLVSQIEIYDQVWSIRNAKASAKHSEEAVALVKEFVAMLEKIPDGCAEFFPFELIDELRNEYLGE